MGKKTEIRLNRLPAITWYWLKMNEARAEVDCSADEAAVEKSVPEGIIESVGSSPELEGQPTGTGDALGRYLAGSGIRTSAFLTERGSRPRKALKLHYHYKNGDQKAGAVELLCRKNSEMTVIMDFTSEADAEGTAAAQTKFSVGPGALLRLVQVIRPADTFRLINDIGGQVGDDGRVEVIQLFLGGREVWQGNRISLAGYKSSMKMDIGYTADKDRRLDINCVADHTGKKSVSEIDVSGVLRDKAYKNFRGTIDFKQGAAGAEGNEKEDVLLLDDTVHNQTLPVILCAEEDVVGNHGATIGRLDEELLFYLESRGMDREEITQMVAAARIDAVINKIPDEETRLALSSAPEEGKD